MDEILKIIFRRVEVKKSEIRLKFQNFHHRNNTILVMYTLLKFVWEE